MRFTKMQGLGNDYLYVFGEPENPSELAARLSDRHFGPGADGLILITPSPVADFRMRIFNADGSEEQVVYRDCVPDGNIDIQNMQVGELYKRPWSFIVNKPPELQALLRNT